MDVEEVGSALFADLEDAASYVDLEIGPMRAVAIHYYRADSFGDEEDGRSGVVMPIVRDTIRATLPSLMRKFFGSRQVVAFLPNTPTSGDFADDATNAVNYVFTVQNDGYKVCWNAFKDALRSKTGFIKWWWDDSIEISSKTYSGVTDEQLTAAHATLTPGQELTIVSKTQVGVQMVPVMQPNPAFLDHMQASPPQQIPDEESADAGGYQHPADDRADNSTNSSVPAFGDDKLDSGAAGSEPDADDSNPGAPVTLHGQWQASGAPPGAVPGLHPEPVFEYEIRIITKKKRGQVRVSSIPTDEVIFCRDGWEWDNLRLIAHRTRKTRGELVAMGVSAEDLEDIPADEVDQMTNMEFLARQITPGIMPSQAATASWDQVRVPYYECYYRIDADGDGISELRKICRIGKTGKITYNEITDEVPIANLCPDPEPHVTVGMSQADYVMDLQLIQSHVWRDILDSLKQSIFPRVAYVEGQVNTDDVLNTEIGAAIRMRAPGMVQPMVTPFTGGEAFPLLESLDQVREQRTGIGNSAMALDGSALQSTTPAAATATIAAAQAQVEMTARMFAEGMKKVYQGILRLLCQHQDTAMNLTINGRPLVTEPSKWDPGMQVVVDTALGSGSNVQDRMSVLENMAGAQKGVMMAFGPDNPLCGLDNVYATFTAMMKEGGMTDTHRFWRDPAVSAQKGIKLQPPGPTPEQQATQAEIQIKGATLDKDRLKIVLDDERQRDQMEIDARLRTAEINAKYHTTVNAGWIDAMIQRERNQTQVQIEQMQPAIQPGAAPAQ